MSPHATSTTTTNGTTPSSSSKPFMPSNPLVAAFTQACQSDSGKGANPRGKQVLDSLMAHLHAFIDEVQLTPDEWLLACNALAKAGKITDEKRNEFILMSDVLGIESLVDTLAHERARKTVAQKQGKEDVALTPTSTAILGPFFRENAPALPMGADIVKDHSTTDAQGNRGEKTYMYGKVTDTNGKPLQGAVLDVWHDAINGYYDNQDPAQPEFNCRGKFTTGADGTYAFECLKPVAYPIPHDSTTGDILQALDRTSMRPAHIHFFVRTPGFQPLITQIFDRDCPHMASDAVFATKDDLVVNFMPAQHANAKNAKWELKYDICLVPHE